MPFPLVLCESIGVLFTSEGVWKRSLAEELRGVFGKNAAEFDSAASPGIAFDLRPDILRRSDQACWVQSSTLRVQVYKSSSFSLRASLVCQLTVVCMEELP